MTFENQRANCFIKYIKLHELEEESKNNKKMMKENKKMMQKNKKIMEDNKKVMENNKKMLEENKIMLEDNKKVREENERFIEGIINNEVNYSINERLFDSFKENLYNDEILKKLEEIELNEQFKNKEENKCAICMGIFSIGDKVSYLPCFHYFHSSCIKNWIKIKNKCPFCNNIIIL